MSIVEILSASRKQDIGGGVDQEPEHSSLEDMLNEELDKYLKKSHSQFKPSSEDAFGDSPSDINLDRTNFGNKMCIGGVCGGDYFISKFSLSDLQHHDFNVKPDIAVSISDMKRYNSQYLTKEALEHAMGPNSIVRGIRALDIVGLGAEKNFVYGNKWQIEHNLLYAHSQFFWTDSEGKVQDMGFFKVGGMKPDTEYLSKKGQRYDLYKFGAVKHDVPYTDNKAKMDEILQATTDGKPYDKLTNNCHYAIRRNPLIYINVKHSAMKKEG